MNTQTTQTTIQNMGRTTRIVVARMALNNITESERDLLAQRHLNGMTPAQIGRVVRQSWHDVQKSIKRAEAHFRDEALRATRFWRA